MAGSGRARRWKGSPFDAIAAGAAIVFLAVMVVWPLVAIAERSLAGVGPERILDIMSRGSTWGVIRFTLWQAVLSTLATLALGLPIAHVLARYRFRGRSTVRVLTLVPFVLPTVVVAAGFSAVLDSGLFEPGRLETLGSEPLVAIVAAHVFFNLAVVVRVVGGFWASLDRSAEEAAAVLGASPPRVFATITLPRLAPVVAGASLVVFLFCFTSFGIILILGGVGTATLETEIRRYAIFRQEFDVAAVFAFVQLVVVIVLSVLSARFQRRLSVRQGQRRTGSVLTLDTVGRRIHVAGVLTLAAIVIGAPMVSLVEQSLRVGDGYGVDHYRALTQPLNLLPTSPARALWHSLRIAVAAAAVATVIGVPAARVIAAGRPMGRWLEAVVLIPLGVSAATLGFGYLLAFALFDLRRSPLLVPLAHAVVALPFVMAVVVPALRAVDPQVREVAATLGATPRQVIARVEWPAARRAVATAIGFSMAVSMGEFGATSFISRGAESFTAPLAVFRLLSQPGETLRGQAMAMSVIIGVVIGVIAAVLERTRSTEATLL